MPKNNPKTSLFVILGAILIVGYSLFTARFFIAGPSLEVENKKYINSSDPLITISGETSHVQALWINGHEVLLEDGGAFTDTRTLTPGLSYIKVVAEDRFGREIEEIITAHYDPPFRAYPEAFMIGEENENEIALEDETSSL